MTINKIKTKLKYVLGTGKSAVVCGLILGLGGDASHTGRPGTLGEYIQFGKPKCSITIELFNENGQNYLIERTLEHKPTANKENQIKSDWCLNRKKSKLQDVKELISSLNIFTDNLCQFLPQEKVVEFCKLNKQQLLLNTEKAVGNIQMFDDHHRLINLSAQEKRNREEISNLDKQKEKFEQLHQHYEQQVSVIRERKQTEDQIKLYRQKQPWLEYEKSRGEYNNLKAKSVELERKLKDRKNKLPFDRIIMKKKNELKKLDDKLKDKGQTTHLRRQNDQIKQQFEKFVSKEKEEVYRYNMQFKKIREQQQEIENTKKDMNLIRNQLESIESEEILDGKIDEIDLEIKNHVANNRKRHDDKFQLKREQQKIEEKLLTKKTLLKRETNVQDQRMDLLRQVDDKLYQITRWLDKNNHLFNGKIFPPMMLSLNAKKPEYINSIENLIPNKDLIAFICTDDRDITKFNDLVSRNFKYRANVLTTPNSDIAYFLEQQDQNLLNYFEMFASDMFTGPPEILAYLYSQAHLHQIPVNCSLNKRINLQELEDRGVNLRRCIANGNIYTIQRSQYDGELITEMREIQRAKCLCGVQNEEKIGVFKQEISELELELDEWKSRSDEIETEFKKEQDCMNKDNSQLNVFTNKKNERSKLLYKIQQHENKLKTLEEFQVDLDVEKENLNTNLKALTKKKLALCDSYQKQLISNYPEEIKLIYDRVNQIQKRRQIAYVENLATQYEEQFKQYEEELKQSKESQKVYKKKTDMLWNQACEATNSNKQSGLSNAFQIKFQEIPNTLDELNTEIRKLEMKLVFSDNVDGSDETQRIYQENENQLIKTRDELKKLNNDQARIVEDKEEIKQNWLRVINELIGQISEKFQLFMSKLNFEGGVKLFTGEDENDFEKYGISVMVRYRDEEQLAELDYNKHSGGERSVATMIYIIALQKLTAVPFRVVDEINQVI